MAEQVERYGMAMTVIDWAGCSVCGKAKVDFLMTGGRERHLNI